MSKILNSEDFGLKLYNKFPHKYREDDVGQDLALKRYIEALSDGGFKHSIDEINGITYLVDPENADKSILPVLFKQFGLEVFNGIPEQYLRYLLPKLGEAWSKKGSLSVVEFITSSLSGVKTTAEVSYDDNEDPTIDVRLEMDYSIGNYFPESEHFIRLLKNFVPFYCDIDLIYIYLFYESMILGCRDKEHTTIKELVDEKEEFVTSKIVESNSIFGESKFGNIVFGGYISKPYDSFSDYVTRKDIEDGTLNQLVNTKTNNEYNTLNGAFYTNALYSYDVVKIGNTTELIIH